MKFYSRIRGLTAMYYKQGTAKDIMILTNQRLLLGSKLPDK